MSNLTRSLQRLSDIPMWEWPVGANNTILDGLKSTEIEHRRLAVEIAGQIVDDEIAKEVLSLIRDEQDEEVAGRAAIALGPALEMCDLDGYEDGLDTPPLSENVFEQVVDSLESIYRDATAPKLVRRRVLEAAVRAARPWQKDAVRAAWRSDDPEWQVTAVFCMGYLPGFDAQIVEALYNASEAIQFEAVRAAGEREVTGAADMVLELAAADTTEDDLRLVAVQALSTPNPSGSEELLATLIDSDNEELAEVAEEALEERMLFAGLESELNNDDDDVIDLDYERFRALTDVEDDE